jgi:transcriptional regulator with PAS, ATPase and Fis domain
MRNIISLAETVASSPVNVFIQGENGTGKEVVSQLIHNLSEGGGGPFVAVNCASIPENLLESELFGYEKGAFTGAVGSRKGRFEEADGGTLFLDEIADLQPQMQPKLLRALQEMEICRVGSNKVIPFKCRIISATNKDLKKEVEEGRFREDLYYRLFALDIYIPPLRERKEDIMPMAFSFLEGISNNFQKTILGFSQDVVKAFEIYKWPGNVRQLRREIERMTALTQDNSEIMLTSASTELRDSIAKTGLPRFGRRKSDTSGFQNQEVIITSPLPEQVKQYEKLLITTTLDKSEGNRSKAAEVLGITRQWLHRKIKQYDIE